MLSTGDLGKREKEDKTLYALFVQQKMGLLILAWRKYPPRGV
jgi:hypothetical protein